MDDIYAACITYEPSLVDYEDFPQTSEPVWILGKKYNTLNNGELEKLRQDIRSKLWFTYRKQFLPIGGSSGFTSDTGWGCMHRCGQMVLAQAFVCRYLSRDWIWEPGCENPTYFKILNQFNDKECCKYSIHNIAIQGDILDKRIGEWFGPNTVAQVLKRLISDDSENDVVIHVAMDNMVIKSEIRKLCEDYNLQLPEFQSLSVVDNKQDAEANKMFDVKKNKNNSLWHPLLLIIPLRLGLSEIISSYFVKLKAAFEVKQCVGLIGGKTNHACYFIGYMGNEMIFLDPHVTQLHTPVIMNDESYHCSHPCRMDFKQLDPSVALCFYCGSKEEFEMWCINVQKTLLEPSKDALFEILEEKPQMLPYVDIDEDEFNLGAAAASERIFTSDDEFELLL